MSKRYVIVVCEIFFFLLSQYSNPPQALSGYITFLFTTVAVIPGLIFKNVIMLNPPQGPRKNRSKS